jgi:hypothetical protein
MGRSRDINREPGLVEENHWLVYPPNWKRRGNDPGGSIKFDHDDEMAATTYLGDADSRSRILSRFCDIVDYDSAFAFFTEWGPLDLKIEIETVEALRCAASMRWLRAVIEGLKVDELQLGWIDEPRRLDDRGLKLLKGRSEFVVDLKKSPFGHPNFAGLINHPGHAVSAMHRWSVKTSVIDTAPKLRRYCMECLSRLVAGQVSAMLKKSVSISLSVSQKGFFETTVIDDLWSAMAFELVRRATALDVHRTCLGCGKWFIQGRKDQLTCSGNCRKAKNRREGGTK